MLYTMLTQSSKFQSPSRLGSKARPNIVPSWSQHGPDMVPKSRHSIEMLLRPYLPSLENFRALAGLKGKLGQTWFKIVQNGPNMAPTWPQHGLNIAQVIQHSIGLLKDFSQILKHFKQVEAKIQ